MLKYNKRKGLKFASNLPAFYSLFGDRVRYTESIIQRHFICFQKKKVFVANPNKPKPILDILLRNQEKLIDFLTKFHTDRSEDEQFNDEKAYLIKQIKELKPAAEQ